MRRFRSIGFIALLLLGIGPAGASGWLETRVEIEDLAEAEEFELALARGDEYLALIEESFGPQSQELAEAHLLLAGIHRRNRSYEAAEFAQLRAIGIIENRDGPAATSLIEPLVTLGETYHESRQFDLSLATYEEARTIGRRTWGLLNQEQLAIVDRMTGVALSMGDFDEALSLQREHLAIVQRFHGADSLEFVNTSFDHAKWLLRQNAADEAMRAYLDINKLIAGNFADDPLLMVRLLQSSADFLRNAGPQVLRMRTNPDELERALKIVESLEVPNPALEAEVLRDIGDWNVSLALGRRIEEPYQESWELLGALENGEQLRSEWFSGLTMIRNASINSRFLSAEADAPWGRVEVGFTLDANGRATGMEIIRSDPAGLLDEPALSQVSAARFRPRIADGELIASRGVVGWDFQYDPDWAERFSTASATSRPGPGSGPGIGSGRSFGRGGGSVGTANFGRSSSFGN